MKNVKTLMKDTKVVLKKIVKTVHILKLIQHSKDVVLSKFMNSCNLNKNTNKLFYGATKFYTNIHLEK